MSNIKDGLQKIKEKASNPGIRLSEIENLFIELLTVSQPLMQDKEKKEERRLAREAERVLFNAILNSIDKWIKGEIELSDKEVNFLYSQCRAYEHLGANWVSVEKSINENEQFDEDEKQESIKAIKKNMEELKKRQAGLINLFRKWQEKHRSKHSPQREENEDASTVPSTEEETKKQMDAFNQQITEIQNQIEELKKNQDNQKSQQQITILQKKKEEIQAQLNKLKSEVSASTSDTSSGSEKSRKGKGLPGWAIILIIFAVLAVAGTIIYFVLERKERLKLKKDQSK